VREEAAKKVLRLQQASPLRGLQSRNISANERLKRLWFTLEAMDARAAVCFPRRRCRCSLLLLPAPQRRLTASSNSSANPLSYRFTVASRSRSSSITTAASQQQQQQDERHVRTAAACRSPLPPPSSSSSIPQQRPAPHPDRPRGRSGWRRGPSAGARRPVRGGGARPLLDDAAGGEVPGRVPGPRTGSWRASTPPSARALRPRS